MASERTPENSNGIPLAGTHRARQSGVGDPLAWALKHWRPIFLSLGTNLFPGIDPTEGLSRAPGKYIFREGLMTSGFSGQLELHQKTSFGEQGGLLNVYCLLLFEKRSFWYFELGYSDSYGMEEYSFSMEWWTQKCPKREKWGPNPRCRASQWALSTESP